MGLYIWIAIGCVLGLVFRLVTPGRLRPSWLLNISAGIAGAVCGGWIATRVWNFDAGINNLRYSGMIAAAIGAAILLIVNLLLYRRRPSDEVLEEEAPEHPRHIA